MSGMSTPHYAYLDCEDAQKWAGHERIAYSLLHPGATWEHFRLYRGELPALESLGRFTGVLISGSHYSAYEGVLDASLAPAGPPLPLLLLINPATHLMCACRAPVDPGS